MIWWRQYDDDDDDNNESKESKYQKQCKTNIYILNIPPPPSFKIKIWIQEANLIKSKRSLCLQKV